MNAINETLKLTTQDHGVLRFITAGSVDDGKSTLIGRLLFDSKGIFADQLAAISKAKHKRVAGDAIDFSLLTDGLEAEREQGITIDVAYRYFATPARKFIVADTPGHEQYTRNMVTGASTADVAIVLVDITRVAFEAGADGLKATLLAQTKRHSAIAGKLGLPAIIFAVNKMDLVDFDHAKFVATEKAVRELANTVGVAEAYVLPISALTGDNVVTASSKTPWYTGQPLLPILENIPSRADRAEAQHAVGLRFPVQLVARHDGHKADDFRGYMGRIEAGSVSVGETVVIHPSGQSAVVSKILFHTQELSTAHQGQCITLVLDRDVDVSRGDQIVSSTDTASHAPVKALTADICWLDNEPLNLARKYWIKQTTRQTQAKISAVNQVLDIHTLLHGESTKTVQMNDLARIDLVLAQPLVADLYAECRGTGSFILIDSATNQTVAAGMIVAKN
ncbi:GTP-binding protein [Limnobacter humi]|uniref:sulfate adenylyltransferase n=1 Tax=Limnobacter humi TaxID=1778671 RepID=A0ABT1WHD1_9BURK|nr:GTP-binding protein [Limnobacter humi]MCQ8896920.1 GTP-binding protein [Limnobacter humi]